MFRHLFPGLSLDPLCIKRQDQVKIMISQIILRIILEGCLEKQVFLLDIMELVDQTFIDCPALSHMLKGLLQNLVKIPVYQIIFILEMPVKCLTCRAAFLRDPAYCYLLKWRMFHTPFQGVCQAVFHLIMSSLHRNIPPFRLFLLLLVLRRSAYH